MMMFSENILQRLLRIIPHNQTYHSPIKGLVIHHSDQPFSYENVIQEPSICIVINGEREVRLGNQYLIHGILCFALWIFRCAAKLLRQHPMNLLWCYQ